MYRRPFTRETPADLATLEPLLRTTLQDAETLIVTRVEGGIVAPGTVLVDKVTPWTPAEVAAVQDLITAAGEATPQSSAQHDVDRLPIATQALVLALVDQINVLRGKLEPPLAAITAKQAFTAIRAKAATL